MRACMVVSLTKNADAITGVDSPPTVRSVKATASDRAMAG